jgi:hypothetical protein
MDWYVIYSRAEYGWYEVNGTEVTWNNGNVRNIYIAI